MVRLLSRMLPVLILAFWPFRDYRACDAQTAVKQETVGGLVAGRVTDNSGTPIGEAILSVKSDGTSQPQISFLENDGTFLIPITAGLAELRVRAPGFADQSLQIVIRNGSRLDLGDIKLALEAAATEVVVTATRQEMAEAAVKVEVQQRILGVLPNFMVTYDPHAAPLGARQKFELASRTLVDPETVAISAAQAGVQSGYGNGGQGFAKRFASSYGTAAMDTMLGSAVFPSLFKQDPRYFYKGAGSFRQRALYAISMSVVCKGDNERWQYNYSGLVGGVISGLISNVYAPADRNRWGTMMQNMSIGMGTSAVSNLLQEFVIRRFSTGVKPKL